MIHWISIAPDFTESAQTIQPRSIQVEAGETFTREADAKSLSVGEVLVRAGMSKRVELRVSANSWLVEGIGSARSQGMEDGSIGVKVSFVDAPEKPSLRPAVSLIVATSVPSGSANQRSSLLLPETKLIGAWTLSERLGFASNLNWAQGDNSGNRFPARVSSRLPSPIALGPTQNTSDSRAALTESRRRVTT